MTASFFTSLLAISLSLFAPAHLLNSVETVPPAPSKSQEIAPPPAEEPFFKNGQRVTIICDLGRYMSMCEDCQTLKYSSIKQTASFNSKKMIPTSWEWFTVEVKDGKYAFKGKGGYYLAMCDACLKDEGKSLLSGHSQPDGKLKDWAYFTLERFPDGRFALKASNGKYVTRYHHPGKGSSQIAAVYYGKTDRDAAKFTIAPLFLKKPDLVHLTQLGDKVPNFSKDEKGINALSSSDFTEFAKWVKNEPAISGYSGNSSWMSPDEEKGSVVAFTVVETQYSVYIAFQGTEPEKENVWNNVCLWTSNPAFDNNFAQSCYAVTAQLYYNEIISRTDFSGKRLMITGHSQGGVVAAYLTYLLLKNKKVDKNYTHRLLTLMAPRYADALLRKKFNDYLTENAPRMTVTAVEVNGDHLRDALMITAGNPNLQAFGEIETLTCTDPNPIDCHTKRGRVVEHFGG